MDEGGTMRWPVAAGLVVGVVFVVLVGGVVLARRVQNADVGPLAQATPPAMLAPAATTRPAATPTARTTSIPTSARVATAIQLAAATPLAAAPAATSSSSTSTTGTTRSTSSAAFSIVFVDNTPQVLPAGATPPAVATPTEWWNQRNAVSPELADAVNDAYNHFWQVRAQALLDLDPSALPSVLDGSALQREVQNLDTLRAANQGQQLDVQHHAQVMHATDADATVFDNYTSRIVSVDLATNEQVGESPTGTFFLAYHLQKLSGTWKVVEAVQINT